MESLTDYNEKNNQRSPHENLPKETQKKGKVMSINNITNHLQIEMKAAIKQQKATAPGKGTIHLQMIKRC